VSGGLRLQLTSSGQGRRAGGCWNVICTAQPKSNKFHFIVADAVVTPPPTQVACFRKAGRPTRFLSEGFKTAGRFHRLCSLLLVWKDFFARCAPPLAAAAPIDGDESKQCSGGTAESPDRMPPNLSEPRLNLLIFEPA